VILRLFKFLGLDSLNQKIIQYIGFNLWFDLQPIP